MIWNVELSSLNKITFNQTFFQANRERGTKVPPPALPSSLHYFTSSGFFPVTSSISRGDTYASGFCESLYTWYFV